MKVKILKVYCSTPGIATIEKSMKRANLSIMYSLQGVTAREVLAATLATAYRNN